MLPPAPTVSFHESGTGANLRIVSIGARTERDGSITWRTGWVGRPRPRAVSWTRPSASAEYKPYAGTCASDRADKRGVLMDESIVLPEPDEVSGSKIRSQLTRRPSGSR